jgi:hypothetical protein
MFLVRAILRTVNVEIKPEDACHDRVRGRADLIVAESQSGLSNVRANFVTKGKLSRFASCSFEVLLCGFARHTENGVITRF